MRTYTCWCQDADGTGTIWIDSFSMYSEHTLEDVEAKARTRCAYDWQYDDPSQIHVLGIAKGNVQILQWEDICEQTE